MYCNNGGRWEALYCAIVWAMTGCGGLPKQRVGAQRIVLIRAQKPRDKTMSCIGQVGAYPIVFLWSFILVFKCTFHCIILHTQGKENVTFGGRYIPLQRAFPPPRARKDSVSPFHQVQRLVRCHSQLSSHDVFIYRRKGARDGYFEWCTLLELV